MLLVMANEEGKAQTESVVPSWDYRNVVCLFGFYETGCDDPSVLESSTTEGESPVGLLHHVRILPIQRVGLLESAALIRVVGPIQS
jgi:hypothetical protein